MELILAPLVAPLLGGLFGGLEAGIMTAVPGVLGGLLATGAEGAITGGLIGAGEAALMHKNIGKGALGGALTGGIAPVLAGGLGDIGITGKLGSTLAGAGAGAASNALTHEDVGKGALMGAAGGYLSNVGQPGPIPGAAPSASPGAATSIKGPSPTAAAPPGTVGGEFLSPSREAEMFGTGPGAGSVSGGSSPGTQGIPTASATSAASTPVSADGTTSGPLGGVEKFLGGLSPSQILAGGGLALDFMKGDKKPEGYDQLKAQADAAAAQGAQLQSYMNSGQLPPGIGASLTAAHDDAATAIRAEYAARGMSGSSAEYQDIQRLGQSIVSKGAELAMQMFKEGLSETQMSAELYKILMQESIAQDNEMANAIAKMSASFAQMSTPVSPGAAVTGA